MRAATPLRNRGGGGGLGGWAGGEGKPCRQLASPESSPSCLWVAVPDLSNFYDQHKAVMPFLITKEGTDTTVENYQSKEDRAKLDGAPQSVCLLGCGVHHLLTRCTASRDAGARGPARTALLLRARPVRVRAVRVLHHLVPFVLVELGQVPGPRCAAAVVPLAGGQP